MTEIVVPELYGARARASPDAVKVPISAFLGVLVTDMRKHAGEKGATLALANAVQEIANAIRK